MKASGEMTENISYTRVRVFNLNCKGKGTLVEAAKGSVIDATFPMTYSQTTPIVSTIERIN